MTIDKCRPISSVAFGKRKRWFIYEYYVYLLRLLYTFNSNYTPLLQALTYIVPLSIPVPYNA